MFVCVGVRLPSTALIFLFRPALAPHHSCAPPPRHSLRQILILQTILIAGCWEIELHPSISILLWSRGESLCHICFILLSISLCRSRLLSPHWLFHSDSRGSRIPFRGIESLRKIIQFHCSSQSFSWFRHCSASPNSESVIPNLAMHQEKRNFSSEILQKYYFEKVWNKVFFCHS